MDNLPTHALGYTLMNPEKVNRALNGTPQGNGSTRGGVIKSDGSWDEAELLAEYDKLAGYITAKDGSKVKTGSFYDFKNRKARTEPEVFLVFKVNGEFVEIPETEEKPSIVRATQELEKFKAEKTEERKKKAKGTK